MGYDATDLTTMSGAELRRALGVLAGQESAASLRLAVLRGRINLIRAELAGRGMASASAEDLASVLLGEEGGRGRA